MGINLFPVYDIGNKVVEHFKLPNLQNDNAVFRLHYLFTVGILFLGSLLVTTGQYFGSPISCLVKGKTIPEEVMNTYCWIHSTFTLPKNVTMGGIGTQLAHPGVGTYQESDTVVHSTYYQWVAYTLFFQGCCFAAPIYLWRYLEMGRMKRIIPENLLLKDYHSAGVCFKPPSLLKGIEKELAIAKMKDHFITRSNRIENRLYLHKYAFCELLNFFNVVFQITLLDYFLGGMFSTYGSDVFRISQMDPEERNDPMDRVFPKVGKCTFHKYGPSGSIMTSDALCILPLNIINEKIYVVVWFWFMFLAVVSGIQLLWRFSTFFFPQVRQHYLRSKTSWNAGNAEIEIIVAKLSFGDWFTLTNISENIDDRMFTKLISELAKSFRKIYPQESVGNSVSTSV